MSGSLLGKKGISLQQLNTSFILKHVTFVFPRHHPFFAPVLSLDSGLCTVFSLQVVFSWGSCGLWAARTSLVGSMWTSASPVVSVNLAAGRCSDLVRLQVNMGEVSLRLRRADYVPGRCCQWQASWGTLGMAWGHFLAEGFGQCFRVRIWQFSL